MSEGAAVWPRGAPAVGARAERSRTVMKLRTTVTHGDDAVVLEGTAVCYTVPGAAP